MAVGEYREGKGHKVGSDTSNMQSPTDEERDEVAGIFRELGKLEDKGTLGLAIAGYVERISIHEIAAMCAYFDSMSQYVDLPPKYVRAYRQLNMTMLYDPYRRIIAMKSDGSFWRMNGPVRDKELFGRFCEMMIDAQGEIDTIYAGSDLGRKYGSYHGKFGSLIQCFFMFVVDEPGHPVGMPFPGGFTIEARDGAYYCPVRDKEKDVKYAMCNFCPAKQATMP